MALSLAKCPGICRRASWFSTNWLLPTGGTQATQTKIYHPGPADQKVVKVFPPGFVSLPWDELPAEDVLVSALGGSLRTVADWPQTYPFPPLNLPVPPVDTSAPPDGEAPLTHTMEGFHQEHHLGRDQAFGSVNRVWLGPFGNRALLVSTANRAIDPSTGLAVVQTVYTLRIIDRVFEFDPQQFTQPFSAVRIATTQFPPLNYINGVLTLLESGEPCYARYEATDFAGNVVAFDCPLSILADLAARSTTLSLNQQKVAYAPQDDPASMESVFETGTVALTIGTDRNGQCTYSLTSATVHHPLIQRFTKSDATTPAAPGTQAAAPVVTLTPYGDPKADTLARISADGGNLPVMDGGSDSSKYGALASPQITFRYLSKAVGPVGYAPDNSGSSSKPRDAKGNNPFSDLFAIRILGSFPLSDMVGGDPSQVRPAFSTQNGALSMKVDLQKANGQLPGVSIAGVASLTAQGVHIEAGIDPAGALSATCTLDAPVITIGSGIVTFTFDAMTFTSRAGQKPAVSVQLDKDHPPAFGGPLEFVQKIMSLVPATLFSNPPAIEITDAACKLSCGMAVPDVGFGAFALSNMALDAVLTIPFESSRSLSPSISEPSTCRSPPTCTESPASARSGSRSPRKGRSSRAAWRSAGRLS